MRIYIVALLIIVIFTLGIDFLLWLFFKSYRKSLNHSLQRLINLAFWSIPFVFISFFLYLSAVVDSETIDETNYHYFTLLNGIYLLFYVPKILMIIFYTISHVVLWFKAQIIRKTSNTNLTSKGKKITRAQFLGKMSLIIGAIPFASLMYNITNGRFKFTVSKNTVTINDLPSGLEGLRIIQLSDIHLGNFNARYHLLDGIVSHINQLNADLIFITGDLVNNFASEAKGWDKVFSQLEAKHGKYAVLGNHDYGDYSQWHSQKLKQLNFEKIKKAYQNLGFELLLNSNKALQINGAALSLIGVENWGHPPFPRYGQLDKAMEGKLESFKILLSHDPDHWEAEVLKHTNINLSLAGHTHGMQMGVKFKNRQWSPAQWKYKYWGGLYQRGEQYLYVNRGLGFVGVPLRVGMPPEITFLKLAASMS